MLLTELHTCHSLDLDELPESRGGISFPSLNLEFSSRNYSSYDNFYTS